MSFFFVWFIYIFTVTSNRNWDDLEGGINQPEWWHIEKPHRIPVTPSRKKMNYSSSHWLIEWVADYSLYCCSGDAIIRTAVGNRQISDSPRIFQVSLRISGEPRLNANTFLARWSFLPQSTNGKKIECQNNDSKLVKAHERPIFPSPPPISPLLKQRLVMKWIRVEVLQSNGWTDSRGQFIRFEHASQLEPEITSQ